MAGAQQLWNIEEVAAQPGPPILMDGVAVSAAVARAPTAEAATVQVVFDYLRLGMGYLEFPLPDGSMIAAENAVFEDRGSGNLMWTGKVPGAGYESVVLTVQDGHLVGWFGEPGGPKYVVYAGPDGRGSLAVEVGPTGDWCGAGEGPGPDLARDVAAAPDRPVSVTSASSDSRLDILVLHPAGLERYWAPLGGPAVGFQQLEDYLNMVFRNGEIPAEANLIPVRWEPEIFNRPSAQGSQYDRSGTVGSEWHWEFFHSREADRLIRRSVADLVVFMSSTEGGGGAFGLRTTLEPGVVSGFSDPHYGVFAHEIGHGLGGRHEPVTFGDRFDEVQSWSLRPYAFGHTDLTSCGKREGWGKSLICPATLMSYGQDLWDKPKSFATKEPFYSSVRHKPNGWTIGVAGTSEVERVFYETVPVAVRSGEEAPRRSAEYRHRISAHWTGRDTMRVTLPERLSGRGLKTIVSLGLQEGANDEYSYGSEYENGDGNLKPQLDADGYVTGLDIAGLRPGGRYRLSVRDVRDSDGLYFETFGSDVLDLGPPRAGSGSPAAPSQVGARVTGRDSVRLHWTDNSDVETGYEVWYRKWSSEEPDEVWRRYGDPLPARTRHVDVDGLTAEEEIGVRHYTNEAGVSVLGTAMRGRYSFVVVAYNDKGWNASETFDLEFMPGPHPEPTTAGELTDCITWSRPTGIDLDGYQVDACLETPDGARRRAWDYQLDADQSGLLYFFDRDNAEILVKVLDGCAINGHRWVFVAPVTTLAFRLQIRVGNHSLPYWKFWSYDSERQPQEEIRYVHVGNPKDRTARTVSDTTAFPCTVAEIAAAKAASAANVSGSTFGAADLGAQARPALLMTGAETDCEPSGPALTLAGGYKVGMCFETENGETGDARDWGLGSNRMGLLYFSDRDSVEVLVKVQDGCEVNGNVWVSAAPATVNAFNLRVESPAGQVWTHANGLGETAEAVSDMWAFRCEDSPPECSGAACALQGGRFRVKAWYSRNGAPSRGAGAVAASLGHSVGMFSFASGHPELLVRIVDRCSTSGYWEVHAGAASDANFSVAVRDTETNELKWFRSRDGRPVGDSRGFACDAADGAVFGRQAGGDPDPPCSGVTCLLRDGRFRVKTWYARAGASGQPAKAVSADLGESAGSFAFDSGDPDFLVRIADRCSESGYWEVHAGAASDANFSVAVRDTETNELKWFRSRGGRALADAEAFSCGDR